MESSDQHVEEVARLLNTLLADEYLLYTKTRNVHWHIERLGFYALHRFFESQVVALDVIIDDVAERILSSGHAAPASLKIFLETTRLRESDDGFSDSNQFIRLLLDDHETLIRMLIKDNLALADPKEDSGINDFMTSVMVKHEAIAGTLRAYVNPDILISGYLSGGNHQKK